MQFGLLAFGDHGMCYHASDCGRICDDLEKCEKTNKTWADADDDDNKKLCYDCKCKYGGNGNGEAVANFLTNGIVAVIELSAMVGPALFVAVPIITICCCCASCVLYKRRMKKRTGRADVCMIAIL